jgi:hypothetical protein
MEDSRGVSITRKSTISIDKIIVGACIVIHFLGMKGREAKSDLVDKKSFYESGYCYLSGRTICETGDG